LKANIKGCSIDVTVVNDHAYASILAVLDAYSIPVKVDKGKAPLVALRAFAGALGQPLAYDQATNTVYLASAPLQPLPAEPVGAAIAPWQPVSAPICGGPGDRRPDLLTRIIQQFKVAVNLRHLPKEGNTYCNIFVWDVTKALGAEIPHWVRDNGEPCPVGRGRELDANAVVLWLREHGPDYGWHPANTEGALTAANQGKPTVAVWLNEGGIGHVAMVRPGQPDPEKGVPIAQAGAVNFDDGYLVDGFGTEAAGAVEYYVHD
jgi:hypothetical protein